MLYNKKYNELYDKVKSFVYSVTNEETGSEINNVSEC